MGSAFSLHMIGDSDIQDVRIKKHLMLVSKCRQFGLESALRRTLSTYHTKSGSVAPSDDYILDSY